MHRSRHLTLTSTLSGRVSARGDRCPGNSLGERRRLERRRHGGAQRLLVLETTDACEGLQASSASGFILPPCSPPQIRATRASPSNHSRNENSSPCWYPRRYRLTGTVEWR